MALISLVDTDRQWFKARIGVNVCETPREYAFCNHTIRQEEVMVVTDALVDPRFANSPLVTDPPMIRFYAGAPLVYRGQRIGAFCIKDTCPRTFTDADRDDLIVLARATVAELEMSRARRFYREDR